MLSRRRSQTMLVVFTLAAVTLMTVDLSDGGGGPVARLRHVAIATFAPVQQVVSAVVHPMAGAGRWLSDQRGLHGELERARREIAQLSVAEVERDDLRGENAALRRMLGLRDRLGMHTIGARVLGTVPGDPGSSVLIDAGTRDGLRPGMTVLDHHGAVGRLIVVTAHHAQVELVTSPAARYAVRVVSGRQPGRLNGRGDGGLQLELNDPHAAVPTGSAVVTRAFEGSTVPDGLLIGTVAQAEAGGRYLPVRPAVDAATLDLVQVVTAPAQPGELTSGERPTALPLPAPPRPDEDPRLASPPSPASSAGQR
jgi:rod shape-determining protein MreC